MSVTEIIKAVAARFDQGIDDDEWVVFYLSYGFLDRDGQWQIHVRGRIFERIAPLKDRATDFLPLIGLRSTNDLLKFLDRTSDESDTHKRFAERVTPFLVDGESRETFSINVCDQRQNIGQSQDAGYFDACVPLPQAAVLDLLSQHRQPWIAFTTLDNNKRRVFSGQSQLLQSTGVAVVSDIDDTIKDTNIPEPREVIANTLFRPFRTVAGMADVYKSWEQRGASFTYLSNGPYQLYEPLAQFLQQSYPQGAYYLRRVDWKLVKQSIDKLIAPDEDLGLKENAKKHNLIPILERFPQRRFILVGDSTERDADIYADLYLGENFPENFSAKPYRDRIAKIYIRDVAKSKKRNEAEAAIQRINRNEGTGRAMFFTDPQVIAKDAESVF